MLSVLSSTGKRSRKRFREREPEIFFVMMTLLKHENVFYRVKKGDLFEAGSYLQTDL